MNNSFINGNGRYKQALGPKRLMKKIEKIRAYYSPEYQNGNIVLRTPAGFRYLPVRDKSRVVYLTFGRDAKSEEEARALPETVATTPYVLFRELFPEEYKAALGKIFPDKRTAAYLEQTKCNIGLLRTEAGHFENDLPPDTAEEYEDGGLTVSVWERNGEWVAEYSYRTDIDDYISIRHIFSRRPSRRDVRRANLVEKIDQWFSRFPQHAVFRCWECGAEVHWLDIRANSLEERWEFFRDKYCGC